MKISSGSGWSSPRVLGVWIPWLDGPEMLAFPDLHLVTAFQIN